MKSSISRFTSDYGMLFVLAILAGFFSLVTLKEQPATGRTAAEELAGTLEAELGPGSRVLILAGTEGEESAFVETLRERLARAGHEVVDAVAGQPFAARPALERAAAGGLDAIAASPTAAQWTFIVRLREYFPALSATRTYIPRGERWPDFLKPANLLNVANQIAVIAILAIGMTLVIITGGIDLSVGSLIALSAVTTTWLLRDALGGREASLVSTLLACAGGIGACGAMGLFSGAVVTFCAIPPFIATLSMMLVASGLAFIIAEGESIYEVPDCFVRLGSGRHVLGAPNAVLLMVVLYIAAHVLMTRTVLGRHIYAVGGNREAARLSGVSVRRVILSVYAVSGLLAGLGGVVLSSQLQSGSPTYGAMYELTVIAAVVVGGTSLAGGQGKILGTFIGAFIIAVIQNGMNLTQVESYTQKVVLGLVILAAVLLDALKSRGGRILSLSARWRRAHRRAGSP